MIIHWTVSTFTLSHVVLLYMVSRIACDCPTPPVYEDKTHNSYDSSYSTGAQTTYQCAPGYINPSGQTTSTCQSDGSWTQVTFRCERGSCSNPGTPHRGTRSGDDFRVSERVTFSCDEGYSLFGDTVSTCMVDLRWSTNVPTCEAIACAGLQAPQQGSISSTGEARYNDVVTITCNRGKMYSEQSNTRRCTENGWTGVNGTCIETDCGLPILYHGRVEAPVGTGYAAEIRYSCDDGTTKEESQALTDSGGYSRCYDTGKWVPAPPTCNIGCGRDVPAVTHGSIAARGSSSYPHNTELNINCNSGFTLVAADHVVCRNGTWTPSANLTCELIPTPMPTTAPVRTEAPDTPTVMTSTTKNTPGTHSSATVRDQTETPVPDGHLDRQEELGIAFGAGAIFGLIIGLIVGICCCCRHRNGIRIKAYIQETEWDTLCRDVDRIIHTLPETYHQKTSSRIKSNFEKLGTLIKKVVLIDKKQNENIVNSFLKDIDSLKDGDEKDEDYRDMLKLINDDLKWVIKEDCAAYMDGRNGAWQEKKRHIEDNLPERDMQYFKAMEQIHNALKQHVKSHHPRGLIYDDPGLTTCMGRYCKLGLFPCCDYTGTIHRKPPKKETSVDMKLLPTEV